MKILFYNWVDYLDDEKRGGGVSLYQRNVIRALKTETEIQRECFFLSSGISYDFLSSKPRWEQVRHGPAQDQTRRFEIVNSGVLAPAHHSFGNPSQIDHDATREAFFDFIRAYGPFDVIHFNNLEGLPVSALKIKERWPDTRVILSLHNYYPLCPQVNLWFRERETCNNFQEGRKCAHCLPVTYDERVMRLANAVAYTLKKQGIRPGTRLFDLSYGLAMRVAAKAYRTYRSYVIRKKPNAPKTTPTITARHQAFRNRREAMVNTINSHCDAVLCVSDRVGEVATQFGISPLLVQTSYIGTNHATKYDETQPKPSIVKPDGTLTIAYLGYMRRDKGFFFLLNALESLPIRMAKRINILIAARLVDEKIMDRITGLKDRFQTVTFANGYSHDDLDDVLASVDLGVIPVLWEDNLPQVAIEMHARHIPLLTSDRGGAKELGNCGNMVFRAGNSRDFTHKIEAVLSGNVTAKDYWTNAIRPHSMAEHLDDLHKVYDTIARPIAPMPSASNDLIEFRYAKSA